MATKVGKLGLTLGLSLFLVACSGGNTQESVVEVSNKKANVTVEKVSDDVQVQEEVWTEKNEETGKDEEVTVIKQIEFGEVVMEMETREVQGDGLGDTEVSSEEVSESTEEE